jgi:methionyl-tRNA formyltransferase
VLKLFQDLILLAWAGALVAVARIPSSLRLMLGGGLGVDRGVRDRDRRPPRDLPAAPAPMRIGWIGFHAEGLPALQALLERGAPIVGVVTLSPAAAARRSGAGDYRPLCRRHHLPLFEVDDINGERGREVVRRLDLDLAFVIGWTQLVGAATRALVRGGMIGAHASLLPHNRGRAPVNWALIHGERLTGDTLFWLEGAADAGDVVDQTPIPITRYDTCATLYDKVAGANRDMIVRALPRLLAGERPGTPQPAPIAPPLRRRQPEDGWIDFALDGGEVYDFVRALTRPYPGAFSKLEGARWTVWHCAHIGADVGDGPPGEVVGSMVSPVAGACGQIVRCGRGAVVLLEVESAQGRILMGPALSDQDWKGRRWSHG